MPGPQYEVYIAVLGVGGVGKAFLSQLSDLASRLSQRSAYPIQLSVILLASSKKLLISENLQPLNLKTWESDLASSQKSPLSLTEIAKFLDLAGSYVILVDNTSSQDIAEYYPQFLMQGISIVTPNKKAFSGTNALWEDTVASSAAAADGSGRWGYVFHESTVGAGLPVISTLKELVETGDEVRRIEGVFSGTMSFLFNSFMPVGGGGGSFSAEVKNAKQLGYTEPDPRDDLNGLDVARKLTILARMVGLKVQSPTRFPVQSLIPKELESVQSGDEFLARLGEFDAKMESLKKAAADQGKVIRFVGSIDVAKNDVKVGLEKFSPSHPIAALKGSDNIISFYTKRYGDNPLIIQGAGAGFEVTAMGVTGDLIKVLGLLKWSPG